jgi:hypothetical protein
VIRAAFPAKIPAIVYSLLGYGWVMLTGTTTLPEQSSTRVLLILINY